jgi:hypothetical protein
MESLSQSSGWVMWRSPLPNGILGDPHLTRGHDHLSLSYLQPGNCSGLRGVRTAKLNVFFGEFILENPTIPVKHRCLLHSLQIWCLVEYVFAGLGDRVQQSSCWDFCFLVIWTHFLNRLTGGKDPHTGQVLAGEAVFRDRWPSRTGSPVVPTDR